MTQLLFIQIGLLLVMYLRESHCSPYRNIVGSSLFGMKSDESSPAISPTMDPQPLLPLLAPSPLMPFTNNSVPRLSGLCTLNFSAAESILTTTATDCWSSLAPYLADVVCCPQFHATLAILIGRSSIYSGKLSLNTTHAKHCLSDIEHILEGQGANGNLQKICQIYPSNLTEATCPVTDVSKVESIVDVSRLLSACGKIDPVNECCNKICENAILDAAEKIVLENHSTVQPQNLAMVNDCNSIVSRWVSSKLDLSSANRVLRVLSSCNINKVKCMEKEKDSLSLFGYVCPLAFPNTRNVSRDCGNTTSNLTGCCEAMESYMSNLQEQSFITNVQASNCAALLGKKLQRANVSVDVYNLCLINLKDFSLQVESQESGCLLPSLPSDVTYDESSGISFICDLNDKVAAPWPSSSFGPASSCNKTAELPALAKATSAQTGLHVKQFIYSLHFSCLLVLKFLI